MSTQLLGALQDCSGREDRATALDLLRAAIGRGDIIARDGIELMLAVRQGSGNAMSGAFDAVRGGLPGTYRFIPENVTYVLS